MSDVVYRPGEWQVVVEESGIAALPADAGADKIVALSEMLSRGVPELTEVIDVLSGGAITGLGSFAVALIGPTGTRFAVRGAVTVATGWDTSFSGEDITTWSERFIPEPPRFELGFGDSAESVAYPIRSGVVLASGVRVGEAFEAPVAETVEDADQDAAVVVAADDVVEPGSTDSEIEQAESEIEPTEPETETETEPIESETEPESNVQATEAEDAPAEDESAAHESAADEPAEDDQLSQVLTETIAPDEVALLRTGAPAEPWEDPVAQPDLSATIAPPAHDEVPVPPASAPLPVPEAVVPPAPPAPNLDTVMPPAPPAAADIGDHDGATISLAEARRLRATTSGPDAPTEALPTIADEDPGAARARIRLSTGQVLDLDRTVIIGRKPRATRASGSTLPHLIAVDSPESDISRNHLEVRPEGDSVVVVDLHTTNGSILLRPGADPVRLHPGEPTLVLGGDVIDVGDGVTVTIEEFG
jgi:hypothetical protein